MKYPEPVELVTSSGEVLATVAYSEYVPGVSRYLARAANTRISIYDPTRGYAIGHSYATETIWYDGQPVQVKRA